MAKCVKSGKEVDEGITVCSWVCAEESIKTKR